MIWLIGARGMLGTELSRVFSNAHLAFVGTDSELSILDPEGMAAYAARINPSWIVNCAAYTSVDKAEDEKDQAALLNSKGPENIAVLAKALGAKMMHFSTDYVFDGKARRPYREDDPVCPLGVYGKTKAEGEVRVREATEAHVIIRTAWLYGRHGQNFVHTMLRLMAANSNVRVVADQQGTPTGAMDLAAAVLTILRARRTSFGTYHFTGAGSTNWHEYAVEIGALARKRGLLHPGCHVEAITTAQYATKAMRPEYSVLDNAKIVRDYSLEIPGWRESLSRYIDLLAADVENPEVRGSLKPQ